MPRNLQRITGKGDLHFITFCCYQRRRFLATPEARNLAVRILGEVRNRYDFRLIGYVVMPQHVHLLLGEAGRASPARVVQVYKQRVSRLMHRDIALSSGEKSLDPQQGDQKSLRFWQRRYYDFNVYTAAKVEEKLHYMHANPVKERLAGHPRDWAWSSWSNHFTGEGMIPIDPWN
jgi:putative transposase